MLTSAVPADGKIRLNYTDLHIAGLWDDDEATLADDDEFSDCESFGVTSRVVEDNETCDSAMMLNAPIDDVEVDRLTIRKNRATGNSVMINHRVTMKHFKQLVVLHEDRVGTTDTESDDSSDTDYRRQRRRGKRGHKKEIRRVRNSG